jgi:glycosyltransferase involved in cell wall biosynthesis
VGGPIVEPVVTIGMPTFNGAAFVEVAVGSLLAQTEPGFLLLISDDRSDDETPIICERLTARDPRIRFVRHEQHLGMTGNFSYLLREATTPFFMWAAQDDLWAPEFLDETLGLLRRERTALGAMTAIAFVEPSGEPIRTARIPLRMADPDPSIRARSVREDGYHAIYALFRRDALEASRVRLEDVPAPDVAFVYGLALHGRIVTSERILSTRRVIGYSRVVAPDGRVVWEKALGPDGALYAWSRSGLGRALWRHTRAAPVALGTKVALGGFILRLWWMRLHRNLVEQTGRLPIANAWNHRRYLRAVLLALGQFLLRPGRVVREVRRVLDGRLNRP